MIRILKTNTPLNYALMFVLMLILWAFKFYYMPTATENYEIQNIIFTELPNTVFGKYLSAVIAFIVFYCIGLLVIKVNSDLLIVESAYQSPGIFYILFTGFFINSQRITPVMISGILIFISVILIMYSHQKYKAYSNNFNSGFVFALAILLSPKFVVFLPLLLIALFITKSVQWKEVVVFIMGILTPLILFFSFTWLYGDLISVNKKIASSFTQTFQSVRYSTYYFLVLLPAVIWSIVALISKYTVNVSKKVSTRKFQTLTAICILFFVAYFVSPVSDNETISILYAPASILISNILINSKRISTLIIFYGIIISICFSQFFQISFYLTVF